MLESTTWLIRLRSAPYFSPNAINGIDMALACGAFGQSLSLVIEEAACGLGYPTQTPPAHSRHLFRQLASMPLYDIQQVYRLAPAGAPTWTIDDLDVRDIAISEWQHLIRHSQHVLVF